MQGIKERFVNNAVAKTLKQSAKLTHPRKALNCKWKEGGRKDFGVLMA